VDISLLCHGDRDTKAVCVHLCSLLQAVKLHYEQLRHGMDLHQVTQISSRHKTLTSSQHKTHHKSSAYNLHALGSTIAQAFNGAFDGNIQVFEESSC
jgi:hypothetical protein